MFAKPFRRAPFCWELRCRFFVAAAWVLGIGCLQRLSSLCITIFVLMFLLPFVGVSLNRIVRRLIFVVPFLVISFLTLLISDGFPITRNAFDFAVLTVVRILACLIAVSFVCTDDVRKHLAGFQALRLPEALTCTLFLAQRYVHLVAKELTATKNSLASRLFGAPTNLKTLNVYGQIVGGLAIKAIDRSEHIRKAMESRGFQGRLRMDDVDPIRRRDLVQSTVAILFLTAIVFVDHWGF